MMASTIELDDCYFVQHSAKILPTQLTRTLDLEPISFSVFHIKSVHAHLISHKYHNWFLILFKK